MTRIILIAALLAATLVSAQAHWERHSYRIWIPDPPPSRPFTPKETLCLARTTRGLDAGHFTEAMIGCTTHARGRAE